MNYLNKTLFVISLALTFFAGIMIRDKSDQELIRVYEETINNMVKERHYNELMLDDMRRDLISYQMKEVE